jgi:hypothetical protein
MPTPTGISGSRAAAILGLSKYSTPFTVWQSIMEQIHGDGWNQANGYVFEPFQGNSITEFGHAFEGSVINLTQQKLNTTITHREQVHSLHDYITCHIDGKIFDFSKLFEGKHCNHRVFALDWGEPETDRVPTAIQCQVQHNLLLTGLTDAVVSVLVIPKTVQDFEAQGWQAHHDNLNGVWFLKNHETEQIIDPMEWAKVFAQIGNFHQYYIEAKPDTQKLLLEMYEYFWQRYIIEEIPPEAVDYSDIRRLFHEPKGVLVVDEEQADLLREYRSIGKEIGSAGYLKKRQNFLKTQILKFAKDQTAVDDEEAIEKVVFRDQTGKKLGQYSKKGFRC